MCGNCRPNERFIAILYIVRSSYVSKRYSRPMPEHVFRHIKGVTVRTVGTHWLRA